MESLARGSLRRLKSDGDNGDPCGIPMAQGTEVLVTLPAVVSIDGTRDDCIIAEVFICSCL